MESIRDPITAIKMALEKMDRNYCELSQKDYSRMEFLAEKKYLERPFAYEFYHQLRVLIDNNIVNFDGPIIQAEVAKEYQHCFKNGKVPDFIIHVKNKDKNPAVIEFKLSTNLSRVKDDFEKLVEFKQNEFLRYDYLVEVILGDASNLRSAKKLMQSLSKSAGEEIKIIEFNTDTWKAEDYSIKYQLEQI